MKGNIPRLLSTSPHKSGNDGWALGLIVPFTLAETKPSRNTLFFFAKAHHRQFKGLVRSCLPAQKPRTKKGTRHASRATDPFSQYGRF